MHLLVDFTEFEMLTNDCDVGTPGVFIFDITDEIAPVGMYIIVSVYVCSI